MPITSLKNDGIPIALQEMREQNRKQKKKAFSGWIVLAIFILIVISAITYIKLMPERFPVSFRRDHIIVKSPANAEVVYVSAKRNVRSGDRIATLRIHPGSDPAFEAQLRSLADMNTSLMREKTDYETAMLRMNSELTEKKRLAAIEQNSVTQARSNEKFCAEKAASAKAAYEKNKRLWNLDAVTGSELEQSRLNSEKAAFELAAAKTEIEKAELNLKVLEAQISDTKADIEKTEQIRGSYFQKLESDVKRMRQAFSGIRADKSGLYMDIFAPVSGWMEQRPVQEGSILSRDETICVLIRPNSSELTAYLPPRYYTKLPNGMKMRVKLESCEFNTTVKQVRTVLTTLPRNLRQNETKDSNKLYLQVDLDEKLIPSKSFSWDVGYATLGD